MSMHILLLLAVLVGMTLAALDCPPGQTLLGTRCYAVYRPSPTCDHDFSYAEASAFCRANGGSLASVHSQNQSDVLAHLIKKGQKAKKKSCSQTCSDKPQTCRCRNANQDYFYWIGMQLTHSANGSVNGSSWSDRTVVDYGNPLSASFRPPFVPGRPVGSNGDGSDPSEVCPGGNQNNCVQVYGFGDALGRWRDQNCNNTHTIPPCGCNGTANSGNSTVSSMQSQPKARPSSSSEEEAVIQIDQCRDEAALNGVICEYCPNGWTMFKGRCYIVVVSAHTAAQANAACAAFGAGVNVVSIHSADENVFVAGLVNAASSTIGSYFIGINLVHSNLLFNAPVTSATWSDSSPVDYANPSVAPWNTFGTYPWAPPSGGFPAQPDNRPPPGDCVIAWSPPSPHPPGTWDDVNCPQVSVGGTVCKV